MVFIKKFSIFLFSKSNQFLDVTNKTLKANGLNIEKSINNLDEIKPYVNIKNSIFIVHIIEENVKNNIIDFFYNKKINWICISENSKINFEAITKGANGSIILKKRPTFLEYKIFISRLIQKINDIEKVAISLKIENNSIKNEKIDEIIAIGASTGGTEAVESILTKLDDNMPPILIVIHMPSGFTKMYAEKLNSICKMYVKEAEDKEILRKGFAYIAPGGYHMEVEKTGEKMFISCKTDKKVNGHIPSVDVLFKSVAKNVSCDKLAVILTGMGEDGALGILDIKEKGGFTIGQDKETSVVYGMPRAAYEKGGVLKQAPLDEIPKIIRDNIKIN